jgi:hypothetical protein
MFHFDSLVPAPVQLGKHSCGVPSQFQSLGRLYIPLVPDPVQIGKHSCDIPSQFQSLGRLYVPLPST